MKTTGLMVAGMAGLLVVAAGFAARTHAEEGCAGGACAVAKAGKVVEQAEISTAGLKALLDSKVPVALFDARVGKYDDGKRIPGGVSLRPDAPAEDVAKVIKDKHSLVVTYCAGVNCPASGRLAVHLKKLGYENVVEYRAGIAGWIEAGYKVEEAGTK